ncbi:hypothetical protein [Streptomyces narbonensis]|uniref:hypothetical protein n=1 Tax=Streptomyces narbonensis TaxID=67333 RepID=UPI00167898D1|nr:hypothetical protein [Streptomyces narbonensis]GGV97663.1 hypothetical protein GCM10010230_18910 [Streptomyces narbonensis]
MTGVENVPKEHKDRVLARRWMEPRGDAVLRDLPIALLQALRFWGGIAIALAVKWPLVANESGLLVLWLRDGGFRLLLVPFLLLVTAPLVTVAYFLVVRPPTQGRLGERLRGPLTATGAFLGHLVLVAGGGALTAWLGTAYLDEQPVLVVAGILVCLYGVARGVAFLWFAVPAVSRHMFRTVEIHQALPALITVALAWELALQDVLFPLTRWAGDPVLLPLGGAVATTLVAGTELWRLYTRHGMRFRLLTARPANR